ncbi:MAG: hypothetical protein KDC13_07645 [Bacteroidetes bacterium]|nr:hypothetical protein [Bacteroidota bacterium]
MKFSVKLNSLLAILFFYLITSDAFSAVNSLHFTGQKEFRVLEFKVQAEESTACLDLFSRLDGQSSKIIYTSLVAEKLTIICVPNVEASELIHAASKHGFTISLISDQIKTKEELIPTLRKGNAGQKRIFSRKDFEGLPIQKQELILANPDKYIIED